MDYIKIHPVLNIHLENLQKYLFLNAGKYNNINVNKTTQPLGTVYIWGPEEMGIKVGKIILLRINFNHT